MKRIAIPAAFAGLTCLGISMASLSSPSLDRNRLQDGNPAQATRCNSRLRKTGSLSRTNRQLHGMPHGARVDPAQEDISSIRLSGHSLPLTLPLIRKRVLGSGTKMTSGVRCTMARHATAVLYTPPFPIRNIRRLREKTPMRSLPIFDRFHLLNSAIGRTGSIFLSTLVPSFSLACLIFRTEVFIGPKRQRARNRTGVLISCKYSDTAMLAIPPETR